MRHARHSKHGGGTGMWYAVCFWGEGVVFCCVIFCLVCFCLFLIFALGRFLYEGVFIVDIISFILIAQKDHCYFGNCFSNSVTVY